MHILSTGRQIGQAVKNIQRLRQIVSVLARHGFDDVIQRADLGKFLPKRWGKQSNPQLLDRSTEIRLKEAFEELGPTFVKLGQLLSTRADLIPQSFIDQFVKLQDNVQPIPFSEVQGVLEESLSPEARAQFLSIEQTPLASASISQVHQAQLKSGEKVVLKVQRPGIQRQIENDIALLDTLARALEKYIPEIRVINPTVVVREFFRTLSYELDFTVEANNMRKFANNLRSIPEIVVPKVYKDLSTTRVLTLECLEGVRVNDLQALDQAGIDRARIAHIGAKAFFHSIMIHGLFHGDLHGGNLFALPGDKIGVIDFGIVGRLSDKAREQLANMVVSLINEDYEHLCYLYADLGDADASIDFESFQREIRNALSPYMGLPLKELKSGKILMKATAIATQYRIQVPGDWMLVFKAIVTIEGLGRTLDPDFDLLSFGQEMTAELLKDQYSLDRIKKDLLWVGKDLSELIQMLPRQIRWMLKKFNRDDFAFEIKIPQIQDIQEQLDENSKRSTLSILSAGLLLSGAISLHYSDDRMILGYPVIAVVLLSLGGLTLLRALLK